MRTTATINSAQGIIFEESPSNFYPVNYEMVRLCARELAYAAGRAAPHVVQADYEQAIYELSVEAEVETGLL